MAKRKAKPVKKKTATLPTWECPKCGACHPITITVCCAPTPKPSDFRPRPASLPPGTIPTIPKQPTRVIPDRPLGPFEVPIPWPRPFDVNDWPRSVPQWWTNPPEITCTVHPSAGPDYQNSGFREVKP